VEEVGVSVVVGVLVKVVGILVSVNVKLEKVAEVVVLDVDCRCRGDCL